ncbi:hypothetical protein LTR64_007277 [Lithohypha guttulata]|uniref:uncharacterized protein n=1 Tax=Lithohypha guttulata TaxID=1690604 RepID=UPI002DE0A569|nr:hypothetical protein LTR51_004167 [Lithohypha guttulata]
MSTSPTRLRQIALVAKNLKKAEYLLTTILGTEVVFVDPQVSRWGIKNILVAVGGDIIEVCSPFEDGTTAGRLLDKRGDGGYMIIMQTIDAAARRKAIEAKKLAKVIYGHEHDDVVCVQYHPKGIPGGMMPELDSHTPTAGNPTPLQSTFSPWHAAGKDYEAYSAGMKRCAHLKFLSATCRLTPGDSNTEQAAKQWERLFGVSREGSELAFTNMRLRFVPGADGSSDGLESISIQVTGKQRYYEMIEKARELGLLEESWINMLGLRWRISLADEEPGKSKL